MSKKINLDTFEMGLCLFLKRKERTEIWKKTYATLDNGFWCRYRGNWEEGYFGGEALSWRMSHNKEDEYNGESINADFYAQQIG